MRNDSLPHFFKLPYVGRFSRLAQIKLRELLKRYCSTDLNIKLFFATFKIRNMFSVKDSVPQSLRLRIINFINSHLLAVMPATLVRPLTTFVHVFVSTLCRTRPRTSTNICYHQSPVGTLALRFWILLPPAFKLRSRRRYIWEIPTLNQQLRHLDLSFSLFNYGFLFVCFDYLFIYLFIYSFILYCQRTSIITSALQLA